MGILKTYVNALKWSGRGIKERFRCNYREEGLVMPWLLKQETFLKVILAVPVFFLEHIINVLKAVFYFILSYILIITPVILIGMVVGFLRGILR